MDTRTSVLLAIQIAVYVNIYEQQTRAHQPHKIFNYKMLKLMSIFTLNCSLNLGRDNKIMMDTDECLYFAMDSEYGRLIVTLS